MWQDDIVYGLRFVAECLDILQTAVAATHVHISHMCAGTDVFLPLCLESVDVLQGAVPAPHQPWVAGSGVFVSLQAITGARGVSHRQLVACYDTLRAGMNYSLN
jgi:hypothetical protein